MTDTGLGSDSATGDNGGDTGSTATWDPYNGLAGVTACDKVSGTPAAGATGYFVGDYSISGSTFQGVEDWVLFANQAWIDAADTGRDCTMRWNVVGNVEEPSSCIGCTDELVVQATFDAGVSDCPEGLEQYEGTDFVTRYYVNASDPNNASFSFESGTEFASGVLSSARGAYLTEYSCNWF